MATLSAVDISSLLLVEGSAPSSPAAGKQRLFVRSSDHLLCIVNSSGTVTPYGGALTNPMSAVGDIIQGTTAGAPAALAAPLAGKVLTGAGVAAALVYAYPPGYELAYNEVTSPVSPTHTSEGTADTYATASAVTFDGTPVWIEGYVPSLVNRNATDNTRFWLYEDGSSIGEIGRTTNPGASGAGAGEPVTVKRRMTPSAGSHTYSIRVSTGGSGASLGCGAGGAGNLMPGYIAIKKV